MTTAEQDDSHVSRMPPAWPIGGGTMGAYIRDHDWGSSPLGPSAGWQAGLRAGVDFLLSIGVPMMMMAGPDLIRIYNDACAELMGEENAERLGRPGLGGDDRFFDIDPATVKRVLGGETVMSADPRRATTNGLRGDEKWLRLDLSPARGNANEIVGVVLVAFDVTDNVIGMRNLAAELQHRVRNNLAVVRSIARRTAENSSTVDELASHLDGRLGAFGRAQATATRYMSLGVDLHSIIADEMQANATREGDEFTLSGPRIDLQPKAAEILALAFHELAMNAIKFGALSLDDGSIAVSWRVETGRLVIVWSERRSGLALSKPSYRGFGSEHLERTLNFELDAQTTLDYAATGLRCTIDLPAEMGVLG